MSEQQKPAAISLGSKPAQAATPAMEPNLPDLNIDELTTLKSRADLLGINYSNNIGVDALKQKIKDHLEGTKDKGAASAPKPDTDVYAPEGNQYSRPLNEVTDPNIIRERMYEENMRLIRVRITNLNPAKKDLPGEIVTVSNKYLGTVRKFIPFGEMTDNGYHIPMILLKEIRERRFLSLRVRKGKNGVGVPDQQWVKEFSIEELPPLTQKELEQLARQQAAERGE